MRQPGAERSHYPTDDAQSEQPVHDQPAPARICLLLVAYVVVRLGPEPPAEDPQHPYATSGAGDGGDRVECCPGWSRQHRNAPKEGCRGDQSAADRAAPALEGPGDRPGGRDHYEHDDGQEGFVQRTERLNGPLFGGARCQLDDLRTHGNAGIGPRTERDAGQLGDTERDGGSGDPGDHPVIRRSHGHRGHFTRGSARCRKTLVAQCRWCLLRVGFGTPARGRTPVSTRCRSVRRRFASSSPSSSAPPTGWISTWHR